MKQYADMSKEELLLEEQELKKQYKDFQDLKLNLNIARGKPCKEQLDMVMPILDTLNSKSEFDDEDGVDCRNFGGLRGIPEAKKLFSEYMGVTTDEIFIAGSSSLTFMFQCFANAVLGGVFGAEKPWKDEKNVKFLCPVPGYDRHFAMCEFLGIEMINVPLYEDGPDMDMVEKLVSEDESIKGIWCVPKYSNPYGCVYSDETVRRFARLKPKAKGFRIFWDNAYEVHDIYEKVTLLNLLDECKKAGNPHLAYMFGSTSKITIPGAGVSFLAASADNIDYVAKQMAAQALSWDKMNMLRHVRYLKNMDNIHDLMSRHAAILRPRFDAVLNTFDRELSDCDAGEWTRPKGGYFVTFKAKNGCAKRIVSLCQEAGVTLTDAGATHPYHKDPEDAYIRIAPSFATVEEVAKAMELFCIAAKLAAVEAELKA